MPKIPEILGVKPENLEYINILARHISLPLGKLNYNQESEDYI